MTEVTNLRFEKLQSDLSRIGAKQSAHNHLDSVLKKWEAGRLSLFSPAGRYYAVVEELRWGHFGDFVLKYSNSPESQQFLADLVNGAIIQLKKDVSDQRHDAKRWLDSPTGRKVVNADAAPGLGYMGDWATKTEHPFVYATTQLPSQLPIGLPRIFDAVRIGEAVVEEVFGTR